MHKDREQSSEEMLFRFFNEIGIIAQLSANSFERLLPHDLTLAQFSLLNHCVRVGDGWPPARLAAAFQVTRGTMTSTLQRLEAKRLIRIGADDHDGRAKRVWLTSQGRTARADALKAVAPELSRIARAMKMKDIEAALPLLETLRSWLDADRSR